ncbi:MAG: CHASE2 domain-containing protein, partial [Pyrinomonadaceae bacterium]
MRTSESSASAHFQKLRFFASFAIASVITFVLELGIEHSIRTGEHQDLTHSIFGMSDIYQRIVTAGVRKPVPRYTVIVEINPEKDPSAINLHHICRQRQFLSELVKAIASANPAVIAIDGYFEKQQCPGNGTSSLLETLEEVGKTTPVVIGRAIDEKTRAIDGRTPVLLPTLPLPIDQEHMLEEGVINIGLDTRKLPLQWKVLNGRFENNPEFIWRETLPLVAAKAYEPGLLNKHQRLQRFLNEKEHPFVSFLQESRFTVYQASQVINAPQHIAQKHGRQCFPDDNGPVPKRCLRGKIVIVGEAHPM